MSTSTGSAPDELIRKARQAADQLRDAIDQAKVRQGSAKLQDRINRLVEVTQQLQLKVPNIPLVIVPKAVTSVLTTGGNYAASANFLVQDSLVIRTVVPDNTFPKTIQGFVDGVPGTIHDWDIPATGRTYDTKYGFATDAMIGNHQIWMKVTFQDGLAIESNSVSVIVSPLTYGARFRGAFPPVLNAVEFAPPPPPPPPPITIGVTFGTSQPIGTFVTHLSDPSIVNLPPPPAGKHYQAYQGDLYLVDNPPNLGAYPIFVEHPIGQPLIKPSEEIAILQARISGLGPSGTFDVTRPYQLLVQAGEALMGLDPKDPVAMRNLVRQIISGYGSSAQYDQNVSKSTKEYAGQINEALWVFQNLALFRSEIAQLQPFVAAYG